MNCFQHSNKAAVGHCTFCGRGLCQDCATVVDGKLSCRGACREEITRERRLFVRTETAIGQRSVVYETSSGVYQRSYAISAIFGGIMLAGGVILILGQMAIAGVALATLGVVFLMHGIGMARAGKKLKMLAAESRDEGNQS
jgi:hypothetical protein